MDDKKSLMLTHSNVSNDDIISLEATSENGCVNDIFWSEKG